MMKLDIAADTLPKLFRNACHGYGKDVALQQKRYGIWNGITWQDYYNTVKYFSLGLISLGLQPQEKVTIIGDNEPEWIYAALATMCARAVCSGAYQDSLAEEIGYVINQSDSTFVVVEDQEQVDKIIEIKDDIPRVRKVIYWDTKGMKNYDHPILIPFEQVVQLGKEYDEENLSLFDKNIEESKNWDVVGIFYTSGTTGRPKGVVHTNRSMISCSTICAGRLYRNLDISDYITIFPFAWPVDIWNGVIPAMMMGFSVDFPEEPETAEHDRREISPTMAGGPPRMIDAQVRNVQARIQDSGLLKKLAYKLLLPVGYRIANFRCEKKRANLFWRVLWALGNLLLFRPLRDQLGYGKTKLVISGGAAISAESFTFILALGLKMINVYGQLECNFTACHFEDDIVPDTSGVVTSEYGTRLRISDEGEILVRGPQQMIEYYKLPEATAKTLDQDGWIHTGDAGFVAENGHLVCIDRVIDLMKLSDGIGFSPQYIESKLKFCPYIRDSIIVGDGREYISALISMEYPNISKWAEARRLAYTTFADLSQKPQIYELIRKEILKLNQRLPERQRIRRFSLLPKELDADDAELTRTRKLRRGVVGQKYGDLIEAIYGSNSEYITESQVTYRDGRKAIVKTSVKLADVDKEVFV